MFFNLHRGYYEPDLSLVMIRHFISVRSTMEITCS